MQDTKMRIYQKNIKRAFDFFVSLIALVILSPLVFIVAVLIKFRLGSPIIFKQERPGLNEKVFTMYKFRTMTNEVNSQGVPLPDSVRLTRFGKFLRSTSIDELPGLFNILMGHMSIIGPRPLLVRYLPYYSEAERKRHSVRPGLSGLAQISGRNTLNWEDRLKLDIRYVESVTFLSDVKIILKTIVKAFKREGVTVVDVATLKDLDVERGLHLENKSIND